MRGPTGAALSQRAPAPPCSLNAFDSVEELMLPSGLSILGQQRKGVTTESRVGQQDKHTERYCTRIEKTPASFCPLCELSSAASLRFINFKLLSLSLSLSLLSLSLSLSLALSLQRDVM